MMPLEEFGVSVDRGGNVYGLRGRLNPQVSKDGYLFVTCSKGRKMACHRLVAFAYVLTQSASRRLIILI